MNELSDKNKPRKLEDIFREGMGDAEALPPDRLWERIDHKLDTKEAVFYKERMVWFQRLAAACVTLVLFTGGYLFYEQRELQNTQLATAEKSPAERSSPTNTAPQIANVNPSMRANQPSFEPNKLTTAEKTIVAKTQSEPSNIRDYRSNNKYNGSRNNFEALAVTKPIQETSNIINTVNQEETEVKTSNLPPVDKEQTTVGSWVAIENKSGALDTSAIALNKALVSAAEPTALTNATEAVKKQSSRWTVSGKYASQYFNQNIALAENRSTPAGFGQANFGAPPANTSNTNFSEALREYDRNTVPSYSYNTSLGAAYQLNSHWALETGLDYTQNVATTNSSYVFNTSQIDARSSLTHPADDNGINVPTTALVASLSGSADINNTGVVKTQAFETQYRYRFIGIPLKMNYKTNGEKSFYYFSGGVLTNFLMQAHILSASPLVPDIKYAANSESPFQNWQMAATASIGKGFIISKGFSLRAGLEASKYLTSLAANPEYLEGKHGKPYTIGIALSSSYTLGK